MRRTFTLSAIALTSLALGSASASPSFDRPSAETLDALDPTRIGRGGCRGLAGSGEAMAARLALARSLAEERGYGAGEMKLYSGIAASDLPVGDMDPLARRYFDQGLALAYGFNHKAAIRSFQHAQRVDPDCAMCWWGEALANGPNINAGMDDAQNRAALKALEEAKRLAPGAGPAARALIEAQAARYSDAADADRAALDLAYAQAMLAIARQYPDSNDLAILAAESAMNTRPWDYWDAETGEPRPLIGEAVSLVEAVMARDPAHAQASHLYIHLLELPDPKRAEAAADRLRKTGPATLGHLVHMPSHIYYRLGRYADSLAANIEAVAADEAYLNEVGDDGLVRFGYYPHNVHFLLTSAQMMGDVRTVVTQTARLESILDLETGKNLYWVQAIYAAPYFAYAQYGSPAATLAFTEKRHPLDYVEAMRRYARATAYSEAGRFAEAEAEIAAVEGLATSEGVTTMDANGFPAPLIVRLAAEVARGRQALARSQPKAAIAAFSRAAEMQRQIPYNEPPYWYYPVNQSLGAAHFAAGDYREAKKAFRAALFEAPNNALALYGLARTERKLGNTPEALAAEQAFRKVWAGDSGWLDMKRI